MPKNLFQEIVFTFIMVIVMVYAMICYNIALDFGVLNNTVFIAAFSELWYMGLIAFVLELFVVGPIAKKLAFRILDPRSHAPILLTLAVSAITVCFMCPIMSPAATLIIKQPSATDFFAVWIRTTAFNFPMALCWQIFYAGPLVRLIFRMIFVYWRKPKVPVQATENSEAAVISSVSAENDGTAVVTSASAENGDTAVIPSVSAENEEIAAADPTAGSDKSKPTDKT